MVVLTLHVLVCLPLLTNLVSLSHAVFPLNFHFIVLEFHRYGVFSQNFELTSKASWHHYLRVISHRHVLSHNRLDVLRGSHMHLMLQRCIVRKYALSVTLSEHSRSYVR